MNISASPTFTPAIEHDGAALRSPESDPLVGPRPAWWWSGGEQPGPHTPGFRSDGTLGSLPLLDLVTCTRAQVLDYFRNGWALTEVLFSSLQGSAAFVRPPYHNLRHPMIFYYGHTACFFINKLRVAGLIDAPMNADFEALFEVGVDEMSWDDMSKNHMVWPTVAQVTEYRHAVHALAVDLIEQCPELQDGRPPITRDSPLWALFMAMEHERIHLETSSVLIRELPLALVAEPACWPRLHPSAFEQAAQPSPAVLEMAAIAGGSVTIGRQAGASSYGWDNEFGIRIAQVPPFAVSSHMITNDQFAQFVRAGGYREQRFWSEAGWKWRSFRNVACPGFWVALDEQQDGPFRLRTTFAEIDLPGLWPVCVNFHEAKAYMAWRAELDGCSYRLPTEAEHVHLRRGTRGGDLADPVAQRSGADFAQSKSSNLNLAFGSECSVLWSGKDGAVSDIGGNVWDWCEDDFHPLEGFAVHPYYDDFSTPCFDGQHSMILGGSFASTGNTASIWSRFHFRRHFLQQAGFRLVAPLTEPSGAVTLKASGTHASKYETRSIVDQYLLFHFGADEDAIPEAMRSFGLHQFPQRGARVASHWARHFGGRMEKALDVGCAVGGASFELARSFARVDAVDISSSFIETACALQAGRMQTYEMAVEGELRKQATATLPDGVDASQVHFRRADACSLPADYAGFDAVLASNLLCRLPSPRAFLGRLGGPRGLVRPGGILVLASPYSWSEQYTTRSAWLAPHDGDGTRSHEVVRAELGDEFELVHREDMPFILREHGRKYELVVSDLTVWRRKP